MEADQQLDVGRYAGDHEPQAWDVFAVHPDVHVCVAHIHLRHKNWAQVGVGGG